MHLLVLGGGGFLGHHVVAGARRAGHRVTVFSREGAAPFDDVEALRGDRRSDLTALHGREFDAVLDTFSDPDAVAGTAALLSGAVGAYGYVSGMSVYHPRGPAEPSAGDPVRTGDDPTIVDDDPLQERSLAKLAGERAVRDRFAGPAALLRVGIMVGPRDPSDRFTWWPVRLARALAAPAGDPARTVLAPGDPDRPVQWTDARDIAAFAVDVLDRRAGGVYDTVGPGRGESLGSVLDACLRAAGGAPGDVDRVWAGESFLRAAMADDGPHPLGEEQRPLWFPEDQIPQRAIDASAAVAAGFRCRPVEETARDVLAWAREEDHDDLRAGFAPAVEDDLVARWRHAGAGRAAGASTS